MTCQKLPHIFQDKIAPKTFKITELPADFSKQSRLLNLGKDMCYYSPATGGYGIVRVVLMAPETQALFVSPMGCARHGVIASYYYKETRDRTNAYFIREEQLALGNHVDEAYSAGLEIIRDTRPKGLTFIYTCADDLLGTDFESLAEELEDETQVAVRVATMNPIRAETDRPPLVRAFETVYSYLTADSLEEDSSRRSHEDILNILGIYSNLDPESEIHKLLARAGYSLKHVCDYKDFESFLELKDSRLNLVMGDAATKAALNMKSQLGIDFLRLPLTLLSESIVKNYHQLEEALGISLDYKDIQDTEESTIKELLSSHPLEGLSMTIGSSNSYSSFELARLLVMWGAEVREIYSNAISKSDEMHLEWLKKHSPETLVLPPDARTALMLNERKLNADLALGLDAAYYSNAHKYVDLSFESPLYGFVGQRKLLQNILSPKEISSSFESLLSKSSLVV